MEIRLLSGWPTVAARAPTPMRTTSHVASTAQACAADQRARRYRREDIGAFRRTGGGVREGARVRALGRPVAVGARVGSSPARRCATASARFCAIDGTAASGPAVAARARTRRGTRPRRRRRGWRRRSRRRGPAALRQASRSQPSSQSSQACSSTRIRPAGVRGRLAGGGQHADALDEGVVARVGDDRERAVEHVLVGGAGLEAGADGREELGEAGGQHGLDRGEVVEEGAARHPGAVGDAPRPSAPRRRSRAPSRTRRR